MASAVLSSRQGGGGELFLIGLEVEPATAEAFAAPGQYVKVKTPTGHGYFVLANDVGAPRWELLVKNSGDAAAALISLPIGSELAIEGPLGHGFSADRMRSRHVAVAVVGSAISVARPLVRQRVRDGAAELTHLFLGLRSSSDLPLPHEVRSWAQQGVRVVLCLSGPLGPSSGEALPQPELLPEARRAGTYVQQALGAALEAGEVPAGALVVAAGPDAMLADLRALERRAGEAEVGRPFIEVLTNV